MLEMIEKQRGITTSKSETGSTLHQSSQDLVETVGHDGGVGMGTSDGSIFFMDTDELTTSSPSLLVEQQTSTDLKSDTSTSKRRKHKDGKQKSFDELDVDKYMAKREMSPFQERMNAVTVMPGAFYCIMFVLSGAWLSPSFVQEHSKSVMAAAPFDDTQCLNWSWMPHLHAAPPIPLVAAALGIVAHAPFSFIYHWKFAHRLPAGLPRTNHWSRRMDQAMIHFCSACMAYATSGRVDFFLVNALFNLDCIYRHFTPKVYPRRNQMRIFLSLVAYTIPLLRRGDWDLFFKLWSLFTVSGWLFGQYPIGGWSHSVFHIVMAFVPPLLMTAAVELPASHKQLEVAAQCALLAKDNLVVS
ncbi:hypothetical protein IV203_003282 [Nitzschia inconspicua]|uniref:Uncharacterized protein n=1 Tax=Nitzschia inconspicua TaxID=303405 RepID=A0A9K3L392_9STRA|nr:hypothetical protein IV203_003282 [Nitzschia inconspicua]